MSLTDRISVESYFHFLSCMRFLNFSHTLPSFLLVQYLQKTLLLPAEFLFAERLNPSITAMSCPSHVQVHFFKNMKCTNSLYYHIVLNISHLGHVLYSWGDFCVKSPAASPCTCFFISVRPFIH